ncbi:alpha beta hydrolase [Aureococcus anophagefferens]|nr:alpha beta hydrolase [Aureococcus anophagefferens]
MVSFSKETVIATSAVAVGVALLARKVRALSDAKHATTAFAEREDCHLTLPGPHPLFPEFEVNGQGLRIFTRAWAPASAPRATVLLVHGFAEHSGRYGALGAALAAAGYAVVALDHQGHGRSEGCRGHVERFGALVGGVAPSRRRCAPDLPLFLVGHSMGAQVCIHAAASGRVANLRGVALSAPALELPGGFHGIFNEPGRERAYGLLVDWRATLLA